MVESLKVTEVEDQPIREELLRILACPRCKAAVELVGRKLRCTVCGRLYPIEDGIPIMLEESAELPQESRKP